jgi:hypothetical protein
MQLRPKRRTYTGGFMRVLWAGFLLTGLLLVGVSVYDSVQAPAAPAAPTVSTCEDGTGFPHP